MRIARIYTGDDGRSHFEDIEVRFTEGGAMRPRTAPLPALSATLSEGGTVPDMDFHVAPRRQFVITLSGRLEMECGDGTKRQFGPGDVFLADDRTGQGHISRTIEAPRSSVAVPLGEGSDLDALRG
jgi:hypothetical protein